MNAGVRTGPWGVWNTPVRAEPDRPFNVNANSEPEFEFGFAFPVGSVFALETLAPGFVFVVVVLPPPYTITMASPYE
jgi:hypothetical protein